MVDLVVADRELVQFGQMSTATSSEGRIILRPCAGGVCGTPSAAYAKEMPRPPFPRTLREFQSKFAT